ncbi:nuclear transport factor 2 family protein [Aureisphaera galaxeae]|uniref:nuclear transport factor 2 family protein n=1 Tax=Aureisphaera galaxeae TaxID=1538023 RepID=UPI00234FFDA0|nr:nuclear transport factor 2 family protein [Aureisphaera galaxeae]MDC8004281.1 nuclear transport factor 2 family protein [Aureisphaera galaxeae]
MMKTVTMMMIFLLGCQNPQKTAMTMDETSRIQETVTKLFVGSDNRDWNGVEAQFASKVLLDYSSMTGNTAAEVTPKEITTAWKTVLPGFSHTHHQIGNFITKVDEDEAKSSCYGTATHYLEDENGSLWTVVGSYDFDLKKIENDWKISAMTFHYKYQDGNGKLVEKAIENVKNK